MLGKILLFRTSEHCWENNWVNNVAFSRQFNVKLLFITLFRILQLDFSLVLKLVNLLARFNI